MTSRLSPVVGASGPPPAVGGDENEPPSTPPSNVDVTTTTKPARRTARRRNLAQRIVAPRRAALNAAKAIRSRKKRGDEDSVGSDGEDKDGAVVEEKAAAALGGGRKKRKSTGPGKSKTAKKVKTKPKTKSKAKIAETKLTKKSSNSKKNKSKTEIVHSVIEADRKPAATSTDCVESVENVQSPPSEDAAFLPPYPSPPHVRASTLTSELSGGYMFAATNDTHSPVWAGSSIGDAPPSTDSDTAAAIVDPVLYCDEVLPPDSDPEFDIPSPAVWEIPPSEVAREETIEFCALRCEEDLEQEGSRQQQQDGILFHLSDPALNVPSELYASPARLAAIRHEKLWLDDEMLASPPIRPLWQYSPSIFDEAPQTPAFATMTNGAAVVTPAKKSVKKSKKSPPQELQELSSSSSSTPVKKKISRKSPPPQPQESSPVSTPAEKKRVKKSKKSSSPSTPAQKKKAPKRKSRPQSKKTKKNIVIGAAETEPLSSRSVEGGISLSYILASSTRVSASKVPIAVATYKKEMIAAGISDAVVAVSSAAYEEGLKKLSHAHAMTEEAEADMAKLLFGERIPKKKKKKNAPEDENEGKKIVEAPSSEKGSNAADNLDPIIVGRPVSNAPPHRAPVVSDEGLSRKQTEEQSAQKQPRKLEWDCDAEEVDRLLLSSGPLGFEPEHTSPAKQPARRVSNLRGHKHFLLPGADPEPRSTSRADDEETGVPDNISFEPLSPRGAFTVAIAEDAEHTVKGGETFRIFGATFSVDPLLPSARREDHATENTSEEAAATTASSDLHQDNAHVLEALRNMSSSPMPSSDSVSRSLPCEFPGISPVPVTINPGIALLLSGELSGEGRCQHQDMFEPELGKNTAPCSDSVSRSLPCEFPGISPAPVTSNPGIALLLSGELSGKGVYQQQGMFEPAENETNAADDTERSDRSIPPPPAISDGFSFSPVPITSHSAGMAILLQHENESRHRHQPEKISKTTVAWDHEKAHPPPGSPEGHKEISSSHAALASDDPDCFVLCVPGKEDRDGQGWSSPKQRGGSAGNLCFFPVSVESQEGISAECPASAGASRAPPTSRFPLVPRTRHFCEVESSLQRTGPAVVNFPIKPPFNGGPAVASKAFLCERLDEFEIDFKEEDRHDDEDYVADPGAQTRPLCSSFVPITPAQPPRAEPFEGDAKDLKREKIPSPTCVFDFPPYGPPSSPKPDAVVMAPARVKIASFEPQVTIVEESGVVIDLDELNEGGAISTPITVGLVIDDLPGGALQSHLASPFLSTTPKRFFATPPSRAAQLLSPLTTRKEQEEDDAHNDEPLDSLLSPHLASSAGAGQPEVGKVELPPGILRRASLTGAPTPLRQAVAAGGGGLSPSPPPSKRRWSVPLPSGSWLIGPPPPPFSAGLDSAALLSPIPDRATVSYHGVNGVEEIKVEGV